jgi:PqqD family protein of HPr-rel-A system
VPETKPRRVDGVEVNEVADGYVVYDPRADKVHYLNHTAALVLECCTGENTSEEIVRVVQLAFELPEPPVGETQACLYQLRDQGLVT